MSQSPDSSLPDYVQNALEATCDALVTLETIRRSGAGARVPGRSSGHQMAQAIASLRQAISELRLARGSDASMVALGFVVRTAPQRRR